MSSNFKDLIDNYIHFMKNRSFTTQEECIQLVTHYAAILTLLDKEALAHIIVRYIHLTAIAVDEELAAKMANLDSEKPH